MLRDHAVAAPSVLTQRPTRQCFGSSVVCSHVLEGSGGRQQNPWGGGGARKARTRNRRSSPARMAPGSVVQPWNHILTRALPGAPWLRSWRCKGPLTKDRIHPSRGRCVSRVQGEGHPGRRAPSGGQALGSRGASELHSESRTAHLVALQGVRLMAQELHRRFLRRSHSGPATRGRGGTEGTGATSVLGPHSQSVPEGGAAPRVDFIPKGP